METLQFDSGVKTYTVNGGATISFNPVDARFAHKMMDCIDHIQKRMEADKARQFDPEDVEAVFSAVHERDAYIRAEIDSVFGDGISDQIFQGDICAQANGLPVWLNFTLAILDECDRSCKEQQSQGNPRMDAYMAKYRKYQRK